MPNRHLILASSSRFRKALLERLRIPFEVIAPSIDETPKHGEAPADLVKRLSMQKARVVADSRPHALVIGSDQIAVHQDQIVGKPRDHTHAQAQLRASSGEAITLLTGLALINSDSGRAQVDVVPYTVKFRTLSEAQIDSYLAKERPYQCSGSLRADGLGVALLERFEGTDPNALIGLPLIRLIDMLRTEGLEIL